MSYRARSQAPEVSSIAFARDGDGVLRAEEPPPGGLVNMPGVRKSTSDISRLAMSGQQGLP
jgi:hypothetical protein